MSTAHTLELSSSSSPVILHFFVQSWIPVRLNRPSPQLPLDHSLLLAPLLSWLSGQRLSLQSPINVKTALPQHTSSRTSRTQWWCPKNLTKSHNLPCLVLVARLATVSSGLGLVSPFPFLPIEVTHYPASLDSHSIVLRSCLSASTFTQTLPRGYRKLSSYTH